MSPYEDFLLSFPFLFLYLGTTPLRILGATFEEPCSTREQTGISSDKAWLPYAISWTHLLFSFVTILVIKPGLHICSAWVHPEPHPWSLLFHLQKSWNNRPKRQKSRYGTCLAHSWPSFNPRYHTLICRVKPGVGPKHRARVRPE